MASQHCRSEELTFKSTTSRTQICFFLELTWGWGGPSSPGTARVSHGLRDMWLGEVMGAAARIASRAGPSRAPVCHGKGQVPGLGTLRKYEKVLWCVFEEETPLSSRLVRRNLPPL